MIRIHTALVSTAALVLSGRVAGGEPQPNTWKRVNIDWKRVLTRHVKDGRWSTTDGYSDSVFRTRSGEVLIRTWQTMSFWNTAASSTATPTSLPV